MAHVLIVEDDPVNQKLFDRTLRKLGNFEVSISEDVEEILDLVAKNKVDLVVMDVSLSNSRHGGKPVDGLQISRMIKNGLQRDDVPILLATAHAMRGDEERFLRESGADRYISKPIIDPRGFVTLIESMLQSRPSQPLS